MIESLKNIAILQSGLFAKPSISPDTFYLQAVHFNIFGQFNALLKPQIKITSKNKKHLLRNDDVLFAAKGVNNFGVVYKNEMGAAVASSSFIVIRLNEEVRNLIVPYYLAWFLGNTPQIKELHQQQLGTTIPSISIKKLNELEISVPTIEKQKLIIGLKMLRIREKILARKIDILRDKEIKQLLLNTVNHK